jgi:molybdate transport system ATP-binding protein
MLSIDVRHDLGSLSLRATFDVPNGTTALFGTSGSGKSTLLGIVAGLVRPREGRVALGDRVWCDRSQAAWVPPEGRRISYMFQSHALFPHLDALSNVEYGMDRAIERAQRRERARAFLARFRVAHLAHRKPDTFSGGESQRVALARALARTPQVLLLDEPFSALDEFLRDDLVEEVKEATADLAIPVLLVSHRVAEVRALAQRVACISQGVVRYVAAPEEALSRFRAENTASRPDLK